MFRGATLSISLPELRLGDGINKFSKADFPHVAEGQTVLVFGKFVYEWTAHNPEDKHSQQYPREISARDSRNKGGGDEKHKTQRKVEPFRQVGKPEDQTQTCKIA